MLDFTSGLVAMGYTVAGLFFLRFFASTGDRLFASFAVAFWLLAINQAFITIFSVADKPHSAIYLLRLAAFVFMILAIVSKNLTPGKPDE
ncbi:MAG TPA: DUF5985 family protein [Candidatus Binataceae bacterium]|nr:DUF5985 family protein [Candidatus Binataceae bacterium]